MAESSRVDFVHDQSTFLWSDAALSDSGDAFSVEQTLDDSERLGSADDLVCFLLIFREFLPEQVRYVWHSPVSRKH